MIDFAHSAYVPVNDDLSASNYQIDPDKGYLFGLQSLTNFLQDILDEKNTKNYEQQ